jgi:2',3'-cyclic-nucleotide 2'-phosphodiesterase
MRIAILGDVNGRAGRHLLTSQLPRLVAKRAIDFVVANVENAADGFGITPELSEELLGCGIDCMTSGNHIWDKVEIVDYLPGQPRLLRPLNYPDRAPGHGLYVGETAAGIPVAVINLMGRVFMPPCENPFPIVDQALKRLEGKAAIILVDMHAEATSEKAAMGWHLDGRVSAVAGTHTHVATADERVLPGGTAFITDVGMVGPRDGIVGAERGGALERFRTQMPRRLQVAAGEARIDGVAIDVDETTGRARGIRRISVGEAD